MTALASFRIFLATLASLSCWSTVSGRDGRGLAKATRHLLCPRRGEDPFWDKITEAILAHGIVSPADAKNITAWSGTEAGAAMEEILASSAAPRNELIVMCGPTLAFKAQSSFKKILAAGVAVVQVVGGLMDVEFLGLSRNQTRYYTIGSDNFEGGKHVAEIFCKVARRPQKIALLGWRQGFMHTDFPGFLQGMNDYCKDSGHEVVAERGASWNRSRAEDVMRTLYTIMPTITTVIAGNDEMAIGAVEAARKHRMHGTRGLLISGFDNNSDVGKYLLDRSVFATVDRRLSYISDGLLNTLTKILPLIESHPQSLLEDLPFEIKTPVLPVVPDMVDYTTMQILKSYSKTERPRQQQIRVLVGISGATISKLDEGSDGTIQMVATLLAEWKDERLSWDARLHDKSAPMDATQVWTPELYIVNEIEFEIIRSPPVIVTFDGVVRWTQTVKVESLCEFEVRDYPFDSGSCPLVLASHFSESDVLLVNSLGFAVSSPDEFDLTTVASAGSSHSGGHSKVSEIVFQMYFRRIPFSFILTLIVPGILLNLIGFIAFWLVQNTDALAVGISVLLCTLVMRDVISLPSSTVMTWAELFLLVNTAYQVLVILVCSLDQQPRLKGRVDSCIRQVHGSLMRFSRLKRRWRNDEEKRAHHAHAAHAPEQDEEAVVAPSCDSNRPQYLFGNSGCAHAEKKLHHAAEERDADTVIVPSRDWSGSQHGELACAHSKSLKQGVNPESAELNNLASSSKHEGQDEFWSGAKQVGKFVIVPTYILLMTFMLVCRTLSFSWPSSDERPA